MRPIDVATLSAMRSPNVRMAILAELHFNSNIAYAWTGYRTLAYGGNSYLGLGHLASVSAMQEGSTVQADGITLTLEGITADMLSDALTDIRPGLPCLISMAFFTDQMAMIGTPVLCFAGKMDQPEIDDGTETCTISIACENRMAMLNQSHERRYTDQEQRRDHPGDCGFMYVGAIQSWASTWGKH